MTIFSSKLQILLSFIFISNVFSASSTNSDWELNVVNVYFRHTAEFSEGKVDGEKFYRALWRQPYYFTNLKPVPQQGDHSSQIIYAPNRAGFFKKQRGEYQGFGASKAGDFTFKVNSKDSSKASAKWVGKTIEQKEFTINLNCLKTKKNIYKCDEANFINYHLTLKKMKLHISLKGLYSESKEILDCSNNKSDLICETKTSELKFIKNQESAFIETSLQKKQFCRVTKKSEWICDILPKYYKPKGFVDSSFVQYDYDVDIYANEKGKPFAVLSHPYLWTNQGYAPSTANFNDQHKRIACVHKKTRGKTNYSCIEGPHKITLKAKTDFGFKGIYKFKNKKITDFNCEKRSLPIVGGPVQIANNHLAFCGPSKGIISVRVTDRFGPLAASIQQFNLPNTLFSGTAAEGICKKRKGGFSCPAEDNISNVEIDVIDDKSAIATYNLKDKFQGTIGCYSDENTSGYYCNIPMKYFKVTP